MEKLPSVISQLVSSRQQVDTLEKEVAGRNRENVLLKQQLQELTDFAEGLTVSMPGDWSLEEQNTALRVTLRALREEWTGREGDQQLELEGKDLSSLIRVMMAENEEQGREIRRLERKISELERKIGGLDMKEEHNEETDSDIIRIITEMYPGSTQKESGSLMPKFDLVRGSSDGDEPFARMCDLSDSDMVKTGPAVTKTEDNNQNTSIGSLNIVTSSRAKLRTGKQHSTPVKSSASLPVPAVPLLSQLTDEEFCDLQIRLLESGHKLSKVDQQVVEEMTAKYVNSEGLEMDRFAEEEMILQPCQVTLTGLGWGPSPGDLVRHVRKYEGVTKFKVDGDKAIVQFNNLESAGKFKGEGGYHVVEGCRLDVGEILMMEDVKCNVVKHSDSNVDEEVVSSVAVVVKRKGVRGRRAQHNGEDSEQVVGEKLGFN